MLLALTTPRLLKAVSQNPRHRAIRRSARDSAARTSKKGTSGFRIITGLSLYILPPSLQREKRCESGCEGRNGRARVSQRASVGIRAPPPRPQRERRRGEDVDTFSSPPAFLFRLRAALISQLCCRYRYVVSRRESLRGSPSLAINPYLVPAVSLPPVCRPRSPAVSLSLSSSLRARSAHSI